MKFNPAKIYKTMVVIALALATSVLFGMQQRSSGAEPASLSNMSLAELSVQPSVDCGAYWGPDLPERLTAGWYKWNGNGWRPVQASDCRTKTLAQNQNPVPPPPVVPPTGGNNCN